MATPKNILRGLFDSPRKQRRFFYVSTAVLVAGVAAFLAVVVFRGTANAFTDTISDQPAQLNHPDRKVPISQEEIRLARRFIQTAVERRNLDAAYEIVHPDLKGGLTRKQWNTGNIPVITYAARNAQTAAFQVDYSFTTAALLEVDLVARPGTEQRPHLLFFLGLKRESGKPDGRWLVNYWQPHWKPPVPQAVG